MADYADLVASYRAYLPFLVLHKLGSLVVPAFKALRRSHKAVDGQRYRDYLKLALRWVLVV